MHSRADLSLYRLCGQNLTVNDLLQNVLKKKKAEEEEISLLGFQNKDSLGYGCIHCMVKLYFYRSGAMSPALNKGQLNKGPVIVKLTRLF